MQYNLGKRGLTEEFIESLEKTFKNRDLVKISVLRAATRDREELKDIAEKICDGLGKKMNKRFTAKIVGFTMFVKKWRK